MPKIAYIEKNFHDSTKIIIAQAMDIIEDYAGQGYSLTLRQLYYQFVARDLIPNRQREYDKLGRIVSDARLAGYIDWEAIEDRTRSLTAWRHYEDPPAAISHLSLTYNIDMWELQPYYVEVWVEKDALVGILRKVCGRLDIPFFSCRGYSSASEMWKASQRLYKKKQEGQQPLVLHLGDHDPSGIDMTRDIELRLNEYAVPPRSRPSRWQEAWTDPDWLRYMRQNEWPIEVKRIALNMDQIQELNPPPNPAKVSDSRYEGYLKKYGHESWELDALEPQYISNLIEEEVKAVRNEGQWKQDKERLETDQQIMDDISYNYSKVKHFVETLNENDDE